MLIDTHAHIHDHQFDNDRNEIIRRAFDSGVGRIFTIGTSVQESKDALEVASKYSNVFAAVGIHPHELNTLNLGNINEIRRLASNEKVIAIGEIGLDYFRREGEIPHQEKVIQKIGLLKQIEIARDFQLPIVIHCRDAYEDFLDVLDEVREVFSLPVIMHCYCGDVEMTKRFLDFPHVIFSFAGNCTYPVKKHLAGTKDDIRESLRLIPLDRILTETDCPYLAPQVKRGKRNEPSYVAHVADFLAEQKGVSRGELEGVVENNVKRVSGMINLASFFFKSL